MLFYILFVFVVLFLFLSFFLNFTFSFCKVLCIGKNAIWKELNVRVISNNYVYILKFCVGSE